MTYDPTLGDEHWEYDLAIALGYDWVARAHAGEHVPMSEMNLQQHPFTIDGNHVIIREVSTKHGGLGRWTRAGDHVIPRVRRRPLPTNHPMTSGMSHG